MSTADVAVIQALQRQLADAREDVAHYWPAHAAEVARVKLALQPAHARLLVALLSARGARVTWEALAPCIRKGRRASLDESDEQLVRTQMHRLRAGLELAGFAGAVCTRPDRRGYAVAPALGAEILKRLGVSPAPELSPSATEGELS